MTGHDDEFEDFLRRKRPLFTRADEDPLEPPAELDRLILRQARDAIREPAPQRVFRAPGWGMPVALAATLVLAFTVILYTANSPERVAADVAVQNVARSVETAPVAAAGAPAAEMAEAAAAPPANYSGETQAAARADGVVVADIIETEGDARGQEVAGDVARARSQAQAAGDRALVAREEAERYAKSPPATTHEPAEQGAPASAGVLSKSASGAYAPSQADADAVARKAPGLSPAYRGDSKTWLAEIERLRATGDVARADAELAEFKRQHRAYATSPDR
jgi:hypothetical protein